MFFIFNSHYTVVAIAGDGEAARRIYRTETERTGNYFWEPGKGVIWRPGVGSTCLVYDPSARAWNVVGCAGMMALFKREAKKFLREAKV